MRFDSLSEAIQYYTGSKNTIINAAPYGEIALQTLQTPQNTNNFTPNGLEGFTYGQSIWGQDFIINISKPQL
jgi:hypothetical protein